MKAYSYHGRGSGQEVCESVEVLRLISRFYFANLCGIIIYKNKKKNGINF